MSAQQIIGTEALYPTFPVTILTVPGLNGSDENHWQTAWENQRSDCVRVEFGRWHEPCPDAWVSRLDAAIFGCDGPVLLAAHNAGCLAVARWATYRQDPLLQMVRGALLVAPCDPERPDALAQLRPFAPVPRVRLPFASIVVGSQNDSYADFDRVSGFAAAWGSSFVSAGALGHINSASNIGAWAFGQGLLMELLERQNLP